MSTHPLKGLRVLVTAYDLEQSEHRGIAVYSKALIRCLNQAGAKVWLLTEFDHPLRNSALKELPKSTKIMIQSAKVLDDLALGRRKKELAWLEQRALLARLMPTRLIHSLNKLAEFTIEIVRRPRRYKIRHLSSINLNDLYDSPYPRVERLDYLQDLEGIICADGVFFASQVAALMKQLKPVKIDLRNFDVLLTSCPLNIQPNHLPTFVQTVHDLIPMEYVAHNENPLMFSHRLQACLPARRLFVSSATASKFHQHIQKLEPKKYKEITQFIEHREAVIVQPPSLRFPSWLTEDPSQACDLKPTSHLLRKDTTACDGATFAEDLPPMDEPIRRRLKGLRPFRYFLFNSSIEARKNLLFLAHAYVESDLSSLGIQLCVTGKLKGDDYSKAVKEIVQHEPGILLTGYVDESSKLDLYLNAMALLSPSLVEGFGIPVLDAACLGMPTLASDCESHCEIKSMLDFNEIVFTINTLKSRDWASAMGAVSGLNGTLWKRAAEERRRRIGRYEKLSAGFYDRFEQGLYEILR